MVEGRQAAGSLQREEERKKVPSILGIEFLAWQSNAKNKNVG
jgi:hypothetical protein